MDFQGLKTLFNKLQITPFGLPGILLKQVLPAVFLGLAVVCMLFLSSYNPKGNTSCKEIVSGMFTASEKVVSLRFRMKKTERVDGKLNKGEQDVKFNKIPKKIYTRIITPNEGTEVLYVQGQNDNRAYVNPNRFPYITLSLDPYGNAMRNNNHHTIHEVGFDYITSIVRAVAKKSEKDFDKVFRYVGDTIFSSRKCYKIVIDYAQFSYVNYTVKKGETLKDIGYNLYVSDYMIKVINDLDDYDDVSEGQVIKVPNAYARKTFLYIDQENFLPILQKMYDDKGLFAQYEFHNLVLNPVIAQEEFSKGYKGYHF